MLTCSKSLNLKWDPFLKVALSLHNKAASVVPSMKFLAFLSLLTRYLWLGSLWGQSLDFLSLGFSSKLEAPQFSTFIELLPCSAMLGNTGQ